MRIAVAYKWAWDAQDARISPDGVVDWTNGRPVPGRDDGAVLGVAKALAAATGAEVVGVTVDRVNADWALARGADRCLAAGGTVVDPTDSAALAAILAALVERTEHVDLVLIGSSAMETGAPVVPAVLAACLGWTAVTDVTGVTLVDGVIRVARRAADGDEVIEVVLPAVVAVVASAAEAPVPGMRDVLAAKRKPIVPVSLADPSLYRTELVEVCQTRRSQPTPRAARRIDGSEPGTAVRELVATLRAAGVL